MILDHEMVGFAHKRLDDCGGDRRMVERCQRVADVVDERTQNVFVVAVVAFGPGCGLQTVLEPADRETTVVGFERSHQPDDPICYQALRDADLGNDLRPVLGGRFFKRGEARPREIVVAGVLVCSEAHT